MSSKQQEIGFTKAELTKFTSTLDGKKPTFYRQAELYFDSMDDLKKGIATPGFKAVGDDLAKFATGGLLGMVAVETGDKGTAGVPGARHRHLQHAEGLGRVRVVLLGDAPAAGERRARARSGSPARI